MNISATRVRFASGIFLSVVTIAVATLAEPDSKLESVLNRMDESAARFRTAEASFAWTQYNKVIDETTETQRGKIYFRRVGKDIQMAAEITQPDTKLLIFSGGKIQIYQPRIDQVDVYDAGSHREEFESFLVLGFGGGGHEMLKSFDVKYVGEEKIDAADATKLDLTPKSEKVRLQFSHILLWIDPQKGISVQQQLFQASGDYRLAKYSDIQLNQKIPDSVFKLKTSGKTKTVSH
jgi:outer membrane lipoprotein-sorting protein